MKIATEIRIDNMYEFFHCHSIFFVVLFPIVTASVCFGEPYAIHLNKKKYKIVKKFWFFCSSLFHFKKYFRLSSPSYLFFSKLFKRHTAISHTNDDNWENATNNNCEQIEQDKRQVSARTLFKAEQRQTQ